MAVLVRWPFPVRAARVFVQGQMVRRTAPVMLNIGFPPAITSPPADTSVMPGATAAFSVSVAGSPVVKVQWQMSADGGKTFTDIEGATRPTLTLKKVKSIVSGYRYRAVLTNAFGQLDSAAATLSVS
ncbi:MAG TPA: hypothetical protein VHR66_05885 [Gemmataceae bacterium]|jgi:hypothetical protein|nr:hypothetical protein [Gemmataceae bacterium]